jgi:type IV secretory pathway VirB2 component (pilin)
MRKRHEMMLWALSGTTGWTILFPHAAMAAAPWETALQTVVTYMTGSTAHLLAIIAVAAVGTAMLAGHMSIRAALGVILGIAIIFGATTIVGIFGQ